MTESSKKQKPIHKIRMPGGVTAAVWQNETKNGGTRYSATFERSYKDADGNWKQTSSFGAEDLLSLARAAEIALDRILQQAETGDEE